MTAQTRTELDVRPVEPKHRLETIMGAYDALPPGGTLELVVDHDPKCMYYTLEAMHGSETFTFDYLESGPETWRVEVTRNHTGRSDRSTPSPPAAVPPMSSAGRCGEVPYTDLRSTQRATTREGHIS